MSEKMKNVIYFVMNFVEFYDAIKNFLDITYNSVFKEIFNKL